MCDNPCLACDKIQLGPIVSDKRKSEPFLLAYFFKQKRDPFFPRWPLMPSSFEARAVQKSSLPWISRFYRNCAQRGKSTTEISLMCWRPRLGQYEKWTSLRLYSRGPWFACSCAWNISLLSPIRVSYIPRARIAGTHHLSSTHFFSASAKQKGFSPAFVTYRAGELRAKDFLVRSILSFLSSTFAAPNIQRGLKSSPGP